MCFRKLQRQTSLHAHRVHIGHPLHRVQERLPGRVHPVRHATLLLSQRVHQPHSLPTTATAAAASAIATSTTAHATTTTATTRRRFSPNGEPEKPTAAASAVTLSTNSRAHTAQHRALNAESSRPHLVGLCQQRRDAAREQARRAHRLGALAQPRPVPLAQQLQGGQDHVRHQRSHMVRGGDRARAEQHSPGGARQRRPADGHVRRRRQGAQAHRRVLRLAAPLRHDHTARLLCLEQAATHRSVQPRAQGEQRTQLGERSPLLQQDLRGGYLLLHYLFHDFALLKEKFISEYQRAEACSLCLAVALLHANSDARVRKTLFLFLIT